MAATSTLLLCSINFLVSDGATAFLPVAGIAPGTKQIALIGTSEAFRIGFSSQSGTSAFLQITGIHAKPNEYHLLEHCCQMATALLQ